MATYHQEVPTPVLARTPLPLIPPLHIQLLGGFRLASDATPITAVDLPRLQALLAYLVLHRHVPQSRQYLAFLLWPDTTDAQARTNLRTLLHRLRQALPEADGRLHTDSQTVFWCPDAPYILDVADFEQALAQADQAERAGDHAALRAALAAAVEVYRGDLLPGWYDDWVLRERERLRQAVLAALEQLILLLEVEPDYPAAIDYAQRLLRHDPLHEATYQHLMRLYALKGDRASALRVYHTCATALARELGVEPSPTTRDAYERLMIVAAPPILPTPPQAPLTGDRARARVAELIPAPRTVDDRLVQRHALPIPPAAPPPTLVAVAPLVGRQDEWAHVQAVWQAVVAGGPHMVVLAGEAGIGKTRLAEELVSWADRQGIVTASARGYAAEGGLVYAPVVAWLRTAAIRAALPVLDAVWLTDVARLVPDLLVEHPGLPRPDPLTESWQRQRLFEALVLALLGDRTPRLLLIDDLQWCDQETLEWLHYLLRYDLAAPVLLVGTMRPEELAPDHPLMRLLVALRRTGQMTEIALGPLDAADTAALAAHVAGRDLDPALATHLHRETEGNPLFVVETVRACTVEQARTARCGSSDMRAPCRTAMPPTVHAVVAARLAQLSPAAHELVSVAAIIGRAFSFAVLARASDIDESSLVRGLDELWRRRIVREQSADTYDFSHDKLREVAYNQLSAARRRLLHRRVAQALEAVHAGNLDPGGGDVIAPDARTDTADLSPLYPLLAHHWRQAGDDSKTIAYVAKAGEQALYSGACQEAVRLFQEALALDDQPPTTGISRSVLGTRSARRSTRNALQQARWERQLGEAFLGLGDLSACHEHLERSLALLGWPVPATWGKLVASLAWNVLRQILHRLWPAQFVAPAPAVRAALLEAARTCERLNQIYYYGNKALAATYTSFQGLNLAEAAGPSAELARLYASIGLTAGLARLHGLAAAYFCRALETARQVSDHSALAWVLQISSLYGIGVGQWANVRSWLDQAFEVTDRLRDPRRWTEINGLLSWVAYFQSDFTRAEKLFSELYSEGQQRGDVQVMSWGLLGQATNALRLGQVDKTITLLQEKNAPALLALAHWRRGEWQLAQQAVETAMRLVRARPTKCYTFDLYAATAEVALALWEASGSQPPAERTGLAEPARHACHALHNYARVFPIGRPRAWLCQGLYAWLAGQPLQAQKAWHKSLAAAEQLAIPYEQALAQYELGRHATGPDRHHHLARACDIFAQLGAAYDLARAEAAVQHEEALPAND